MRRPRPWIAALPHSNAPAVAILVANVSDGPRASFSAIGGCPSISHLAPRNDRDCVAVQFVRRDEVAERVFERAVQACKATANPIAGESALARGISLVSESLSDLNRPLTRDTLAETGHSRGIPRLPGGTRGIRTPGTVGGSGDRTSLRQSSPQNGNFSGFGRRLLHIFT